MERHRSSSSRLRRKDPVDDAYRSSSEEDDLDLGELDPLNHDAEGVLLKGGRRARRGPSGTIARAYESDLNAPRSGLNTSRRVRRWGKCMLLCMTIVGSLVAIVAGGGVWIYKSSPPTGQSPPWYPTRE